MRRPLLLGPSALTACGLITWVNGVPPWWDAGVSRLLTALSPGGMVLGFGACDSRTKACVESARVMSGCDCRWRDVLRALVLLTMRNRPNCLQDFWSGDT